jgi:hypothetical protein
MQKSAPAHPWHLAFPKGLAFSLHETITQRRASHG